MRIFFLLYSYKKKLETENEIFIHMKFLLYYIHVTCLFISSIFHIKCISRASLESLEIYIFYMCGDFSYYIYE